MEVSDTGYGISEDEIDKVFDPFFSTKFAGRGLGLSVVLGIVRSHGGGVCVKSSPGGGSVFRVFLKLSEGEVLRKPAEPVEDREMVHAPEPGGTVLVVDDYDMVRDMVAGMLARLGFTVIEAENGAEAIEIFRRRGNEINLVVCDLSMPLMNGWETMAALRKIDPHIPVVLASGYDEASVMADAPSERPRAFLGKPYSFNELRKAVAAALSARPEDAVVEEK